MIREELVPEGVIDYKLNPDLKGKSPLAVFDAVIDALGKEHIAVGFSNVILMVLCSSNCSR